MPLKRVTISLSPDWEKVLSHLATAAFHPSFNKTMARETLEWLQAFQGDNPSVTLTRSVNAEMYQRLRNWQNQKKSGMLSPALDTLLQLLGLPAYEPLFRRYSSSHAGERSKAVPPAGKPPLPMAGHPADPAERMLTDMLPAHVASPAHERKAVTAWWHFFWLLRDHVAHHKHLNPANLPEHLATFYTCHQALEKHRALVPDQLDMMRMLLSGLPKQTAP